MSNYVDEIIKDIKTNPETYKNYKGHGLIKDSLTISNYGNTRVLSTINVRLKSHIIPTTYVDLWRLETTIKWWYKNVSLETIKT